MNIEATIEEHVHHFLMGLNTEAKGDKEAIVIIRKYISGNTIDKTDEQVLKTQLMDSLKIVGIGIPFVLIPGASVLMPIIIKIAAKQNIELMPAAFDK